MFAKYNSLSLWTIYLVYLVYSIWFLGEIYEKNKVNNYIFKQNNYNLKCQIFSNVMFFSHFFFVFQVILHKPYVIWGVCDL